MGGSVGSFALSGVVYFLVILSYAVGGLFAVLVAALRLGASRGGHAALVLVGVVSLGYAAYLFFGVHDQRVWIFPYAAVVPFVLVAWTVRVRRSDGTDATESSDSSA